MKINTYLAFGGNCREAFEFYEKTLGGQIVMIMTWGEMPSEYKTPDEMKDKITHVRLVVGDQVIMGGDSPEESFNPPQGFSVSLNVDTVPEAERLYTDLSEGGTVQMPISETFWAQRFAMVTDKFGIPWMINCEKPI